MKKRLVNIVLVMLTILVALFLGEYLVAACQAGETKSVDVKKII